MHQFSERIPGGTNSLPLPACGIVASPFWHHLPDTSQFMIVSTPAKNIISLSPSYSTHAGSAGTLATYAGDVFLFNITVVMLTQTQTFNNSQNFDSQVSLN